MTFRKSAQATLKTLRSEGWDITVKLNASNAVLKAELDRIAELMDKMIAAKAEELDHVGDQAFDRAELTGGDLDCLEVELMDLQDRAELTGGDLDALEAEVLVAAADKCLEAIDEGLTKVKADLDGLSAACEAHEAACDSFEAELYPETPQGSSTALVEATEDTAKALGSHLATLATLIARMYWAWTEVFIVHCVGEATWHEVKAYAKADWKAWCQSITPVKHGQGYQVPVLEVMFGLA